ncbi:MAG: SUMF1/EgtB/PvdO family nonheme iron enzyme [Candidatus Omnitrophica bacterium]|nr:SUMF1/EgtB/PvdO family nonheme iron enzyme [Candidatus Omnitrophota bacterium]
MKYYYSGEWHHATMASIGVNPAGFVVPQGSEIVSPDGMGFFIQKAVKGAGTVTFASAKFVWDYGADGLTDANVQSSSTTFKLFGIEMVYIPTGSFYVGSGGTETGSFTDGSWVSGATIPLSIISEAALTVAQTAGNLWYTASGNSGDQAGPIPAAFPKGYNAFYLMKYEISQGQYRDFLNTLTYDQQETRTAEAPSSAPGTGAFSAMNVLRSGLDIKTAGTDNTVPAVYGCNLDADANYDETVDGQGIACNYLSWADVAAYLDWAALRPMTELEFEKACRGPLVPVANEYAWGNATRADAAYTLANSGAANENTSANYKTDGKGNCLYVTTENDFSGPCRVGMFAGHASNTGRVTAGAGYYGIMELSGNLIEAAISVGNTTGRAFAGTHGNGALDNTGNADATNWPGIDAVGAGMRGGAWSLGTFMESSNRGAGVLGTVNRASSSGGRGARTAP